MRRLFTLLLSVMFVAGVFAQDAVILKATVDPVVGGEVDEAWAEANVYDIAIQEVTNAGAATVGSPGETKWQALWSEDAGGMFLLVTVADDVWYPWYVDPNGNTDNTWQYDKIEVYFDVNFTLDDGAGPSAGGSGHHQIAPFPEDGIVDGTLKAEDNGNQYAYLTDGDAYTVEYFLPFDNLTDKDGIGIDLLGDIGFGISVLDRDGADDDCNRVVWMNDATNGASWVNMDDCGVINFDGAQPPTYVTSVAIEDGVIDENNGTVQIIATVLPEEATNKKVVWSVETLVDGRASVDADGVVTGIVDGTVTLTATAADGSGMSGTSVVTISNQIVTLGELNLIRNGFMDEVDENNIAAEWSNNREVIDGAMYIPAVEKTGDWWSGGTTGQSGFGCNVSDTYTFGYKIWSESPDTMYVDFEDPANGYLRYGSSTHEFASGLSDGSTDGLSQWEWVTSTEPTYYLIDEALTFPNLVDNTQEQLNIMGGKHEEGGFFIDSVILINNNDKALLTPDYVPVTEIIVSGENNAVWGNTVQLAAAVSPGNATLTDVNWSVVNGTGYATIDDAGLLTADSVGVVTVVASAKDDSKVEGVFDFTITVGVGVKDKEVRTLQVYPNPAVDELNVVLSSDNGIVSIYNSVGQKMDEVVVSGSEYKFDISSYAAGIYFVKTETSITKFIK